MSFGPPFGFNQISANPQLLLAASQLIPRPPGSTDASTIPQFVASSAASSKAVAEMSAETLRFLTAGHSMGVPPRFDFNSPMQMDAFRPFPPPGFFAGMGAPPPELKSPDGLAAGPPPQPMPGYFFDPAMVYNPYGGPLDLNGARRKNATRETTAALKAWLYEHRKNPYPTKGEKIMLAIITKMTLTQVSTWFANARRRLKKENKMTWSPRNRPGEDDDDDDLGAPHNDAADRPSSAQSDASLSSSLHNATSSELDALSTGPQVKSELVKCELSPCLGEKRRASPSVVSDSAAPTPKKAKIWSIAETVGADDAPSAATPLAAESAPSDSASCKADAPPPPPPPGPMHFTFNPWQQQMAALNAAKSPLCSPLGLPSPLMLPPGHPAALRPGMLPPHPALLGLLNPVQMNSFLGAVAASQATALPSSYAALLAASSAVSAASSAVQSLSPVSTVCSPTQQQQKSPRS